MGERCDEPVGEEAVRPYAPRPAVTGPDGGPGPARGTQQSGEPRTTPGQSTSGGTVPGARAGTGRGAGTGPAACTGPGQRAGTCPGPGAVPGKGTDPADRMSERQVPRQAGPSRSAHGEAGPTGRVPAAGPVAPSGPVPPSESVPAGEPYGDTLPGPASDAELIARVRRGDDSAYEELYRRHADSVRRYARSCCRDAHTAEDLTGEVFARTLQAVRGGRGPDVAVRAYLLTTVRRVAAAWGKTAKREQLVEDFAVFAATAAGAAASSPAGGSGTESESADVRAMEEADQTMAVRAFRSLPERWQAVLWHTAVEQESPSEVAPLLGLTANATAVLAHRAREGLRQAYLQAHVSEALTGQEECGRYADRLGAHARGALRLRADRELRKHLEACDRCRAASVELEIGRAHV